jgi:hypothetical protein
MIVIDENQIRKVSKERDLSPRPEFSTGHKIWLFQKEFVWSTLDKQLLETMWSIFSRISAEMAQYIIYFAHCIDGFCLACISAFVMQCIFLLFWLNCRVTAKNHIRGVSSVWSSVSTMEKRKANERGVICRSTDYFGGGRKTERLFS